MHLITIASAASILLNTAFAQVQVEERHDGGWSNWRQKSWRQGRFYGKRNHKRQSYQGISYEYGGYNAGPISTSSSAAPAYTPYSADPSIATDGNENPYTLEIPSTSINLETSAMTTASAEHTPSPPGYGYGYLPDTFSTQVVTSTRSAYYYSPSVYNTTTRVYNPSTRIYNTSPSAYNTSTSVYNVTTRVYNPYSSSSTTTTTRSSTPGTTLGAPYTTPYPGSPYSNSTMRSTSQGGPSTTHSPPAYYTTPKSTSTGRCTVDSTSYVTVTESVTSTIYLAAQASTTTTTEDDETTTSLLTVSAYTTYNPSSASSTTSIADVALTSPVPDYPIDTAYLPVVIADSTDTVDGYGVTETSAAYVPVQT